GAPPARHVLPRGRDRAHVFRVAQRAARGTAPACRGTAGGISDLAPVRPDRCGGGISARGAGTSAQGGGATMTESAAQLFVSSCEVPEQEVRPARRLLRFDPATFSWEGRPLTGFKPAVES